MILVHSGRLDSHEPLHFGLKSMPAMVAKRHFIKVLCQLFPSLTFVVQKMKAGLIWSKIRKNYLFWSLLNSLCLDSSFPSLHLSCLSLFQQESWLLWSTMECATNSGIFLLLLGLFLVKSIGQTSRYGLDRVDHLSLYCWGLIETYSAYSILTSSHGLPALQQFIYSEFLHAHFYPYGIPSVWSFSCTNF